MLKKIVVAVLAAAGVSVPSVAQAATCSAIAPTWLTTGKVLVAVNPNVSGSYRFTLKSTHTIWGGVDISSSPSSVGARYQMGGVSGNKLYALDAWKNGVRCNGWTGSVRKP